MDVAREREHDKVVEVLETFVKSGINNEYFDKAQEFAVIVYVQNSFCNISYLVHLLEEEQPQQENKQTSEGQHVPNQTQPYVSRLQHSCEIAVSGKYVCTKIFI